MRTLATLFIVVSLGLLSGCTARGKGFLGNRSPYADSNTVQYTNQEILELYSINPQLPKPLSLGVYFKDYPHYAANASLHREWQKDDIQQVLDYGNSLVEEGLLSEVVYISHSFTEGKDDLYTLRTVAARHNVDALLVFDAQFEEQHDTNNWALTYPLLLPMLFAPGTETESHLIVNAKVWDVRNEYLYATMEAEATSTKSHPLAKNVSHDLKQQSKDEVLKDIIHQFDSSTMAQFRMFGEEETTEPLL